MRPPWATVIPAQTTAQSDPFLVVPVRRKSPHVRLALRGGADAARRFEILFSFYFVRSSSNPCLAQKVVLPTTSYGSRRFLKRVFQLRPSVQTLFRARSPPGAVLTLLMANGPACGLTSDHRCDPESSSQEADGEFLGNDETTPSVETPLGIFSVLAWVEYHRWASGRRSSPARKL